MVLPQGSLHDLQKLMPLNSARLIKREAIGLESATARDRQTESHVVRRGLGSDLK